MRRISVSAATKQLSAARDLRRTADLVVAEMLARAAAAAADEGLSARQFASAAGISKSHADRALREAREAPARRAFHPAELDAINALVSFIRGVPYRPGSPLIDDF